MTDGPWTVLRALTWTRDFFQQQGVPRPRLDAEVLLAHVLSTERIQLYAWHDRPLTPEERSAFRALVLRRAQGEPVAYLTGHREFWSLDFEVTRDTLIPRPDTEVLVEEAVARLRAPGAPWGDSPRIVDVGTGTGCIAIALARELPGASILATDVSGPALAVAARNAATHGVAGRVLFAQGHLLRPAEPPLDAVVSNPPYIPSAQILELMRDVQHFEPRRALDGGPDGDAAYRELVPAAAALLRHGGLLILEIGDAAQAERVLALLTAPFRDPWERVDYAGQARVVGAVRAG